MEDLDRLVCISEQVKKKTLEAKREEITRATKMYRKLIYLGGGLLIFFLPGTGVALSPIFLGRSVTTWSPLYFQLFMSGVK